jgi:hypothetical protein
MAPPETDLVLRALLPVAPASNARALIVKSISIRRATVRYAW